jgi:hypothetical protein
MLLLYGTDVIDGNAGLRFDTGGGGDGGFSFDTFHSGGWDTSAELTFSGWVYVVSGKMGFFLGANSPGTFSYSQSLTTGQWEFVTLTRTAGQLNNEPLLYAIDGAAEFIVDSVWLNYGTTSENAHVPVPAPAGLVLAVLGLLLGRLLIRD